MEGGPRVTVPCGPRADPGWAPHKGRRRLSPDPPPWPGRLQVSARRWATLPARRGSSGEAMGRVGRRAPERGWQPPDSRGAHRGEGKSCGANARSRRRGPAPLLLSLLLLLLCSLSSFSSFSSPPPPSSPPALPRAHFLLWQPPKPLLCASSVSPAALRAGPGAGTVPVRYVPAPPRPSAAVLPAGAQVPGLVSRARAVAAPTGCGEISLKTRTAAQDRSEPGHQAGRPGWKCPGGDLG